MIALVLTSTLAGPIDVERLDPWEPAPTAEAWTPPDVVARSRTTTAGLVMQATGPVLMLAAIPVAWPLDVPMVFAGAGLLAVGWMAEIGGGLALCASLDAYGVPARRDLAYLSIGIGVGAFTVPWAIALVSPGVAIVASIGAGVVAGTLGAVFAANTLAAARRAGAVAGAPGAGGAMVSVQPLWAGEHHGLVVVARF